MEAVTSFQQYSDLVREARQSRQAKVTNCYLYRVSVERLIGQGRFYFEQAEGGVLFLADEQLYYQTYYYLNIDFPFHLKAKDKPLLVQHLYMKDRKPDYIRFLEEKMIATGFRLTDTMGQITADPDVVMKKLSRICNYARNELDAQGFRILQINRTLLPAIRELQLHVPEIPVHQILFFSDDELLQAGSGDCIVGRTGNLCAVCQSYPMGDGGYGWIAVKKAYQDVYGMAPVLTELAARRRSGEGKRMGGWIDLTNLQSIRYHMHAGYSWTGRLMDEWLLDARQ